MNKRAVEFDLANERVVLATMIHSPEVRRRLSRELSPKEFGDEKHKSLFNSFVQLAKAGLAYSEDTITELARGNDFGGYTYLRSLSKEYDANTNIDFHIERLRLDSMKYELMKTDLPSLIKECEDPTSPPEKFAGILRAMLGRVERNTKRFVSEEKELLDSYFAHVNMRKLKEGNVDGFGFPILDSLLVRGFEPGCLSILVGRPGSGKSTLIGNLIRHRVRTKKGIFVGAWEMSKIDYLDMIVSSVTGISNIRLANDVHRMTPYEKKQIEKVVEEMCEGGYLSIQDRPFTKLERPSDRWADLNERNMDYLESVVSDSKHTLFVFDVISKAIPDRRPDRISEVLIRLSDMAKTYQVHFILVHHLNRTSAEGRPTLEGIKNSGSFEEEADNVFALDRPWMRASPAKKRKMQDVMDFMILKQRKGPPNLCVRYRFDGARYSLTDEVQLDLGNLTDEEDEKEES